MRTAGGKRLNPSHPTLIGDGTWPRYRIYKDTGGGYKPKPFNGMIGHLERWSSWRRQVSKKGDHYNSRNGMHNLSNSAIITHGEGPYCKFSMPLMAILCEKRWNKAPRIRIEHASIRGISNFTRHHPIQWKVPNTWRKSRHTGSSLLHSYSTCVSLACAILNHTYHQSTTTFKGSNSILMRMHKGICYKAAGNCPVFLTVLRVCIKIDSVNGIGLIRERYEVFVMDAGGSRCAAANRDLQEAKGGYETRTVTRIKRKIAELEAQAKQEEEGRTEEDIAAEVD